METGAAVRNGCLVVFDIDGTLIDTRQTDTDACFFAVVRAVTGLDGLREDGTSYPGATSAAIFEAVIRKAHGRSSTVEDTAAFQSRLGAAMRARYLDGRRLPPMAGAGELLGRLMAGDAWRVAVATGNWDDEARVKLASARKDILALAVGRAKAHYGASSWDRVVYVGDTVWDVRAARDCGAGFVGIGVGERAEKLRAEGATAVLKDFGDASAIDEALRSAPVPATPRV